MRTYATIICLLLTVPVYAAQPYTPVHPDPVTESWRWRTFPELKGLGLRAMEEDRDGNIWFGVNDSIIRYDGTTWTTFTEKDGVGHGAVDNLCGTRDGTVYAGTHRGLSRFLDGKWTPVLPPSGDLDWPILDLMEASDGRLWCATGWGVLRKDADGWTLFATEEVGESLRSLAPYIRSIVVPQQATDTRKGTSFGAEFLPGSWLSDSGTTIMALTDSLNLAGLSVGDRILRINGERLNANQAVWDDSVAVYTVRRSATADTVEITVNRRERYDSLRRRLCVRGSGWNLLVRAPGGEDRAIRSAL